MRAAIAFFVSTIVLLLVLITNGPGPVLIGVGIECFIVAIGGLIASVRSPEEWHAAARSGAYLPIGHTGRFEVSYPEGSSRRKTRGASLLSIAAGGALIACTVFLEPFGWFAATVSSVVSATTLVASARHPIERILMVYWTYTVAIFSVGFVVIGVWVFSITQVGWFVVVFHVLVQGILSTPGVKRMREHAGEGTITRII